MDRIFPVVSEKNSHSDSHSLGIRDGTDDPETLSDLGWS